MKDDYNEINITGLDEEDEELNDFEIAEDLSSDEHGDEIIIKGLDDEEENNDYEDETDKMTAYEEYEIKEENYNEDNSEE